MLISKVENPGAEDTLAAMTGVFHPFAPVPSDGGGVSMHRRRSPEMDRRISIHEAGHAAVGRLLKMPVAGSTINPVGGFCGLTWASGDLDATAPSATVDLCGQLSSLMPGIGESRDDLAVEILHTQHQILELVAGSLAEAMLCPATPPLPGAEHDQIEARALAGLICRSVSSVDAYLEFCRVEVGALIESHRDIVQAVAAALIERRTLDGAQIDAIISDAVVRHDFGRDWSAI
jgi:hypothetical protein